MGKLKGSPCRRNHRQNHTLVWCHHRTRMSRLHQRPRNCHCWPRRYWKCCCYPHSHLSSLPGKIIPTLSHCPQGKNSRGIISVSWPRTIGLCNSCQELGDWACPTLTVCYGKKALFTIFKLHKVENSLKRGGGLKYGSSPFIGTNIHYTRLFTPAPPAYHGRKSQKNFEWVTIRCRQILCPTPRVMWLLCNCLNICFWLVHLRDCKNFKEIIN